MLMLGRPTSLRERWRRRLWRPDPTALAAFEGLRPAFVITGASEGIGLAFARNVMLHGADVLLIARNEACLKAATEGIDKIGRGGRLSYLSLDITETNAVDVLDTKLATMGCYCDVLINNAGSGLAGEFQTHSAADIDALLSLNVMALTRLCRHFLDGQLVRGRGGIINVASLGGFSPGPYQAVYYASKGYVISLSEALAAETSGMGVRVMATAPGPVETGFHSKMGAASAFYRIVMPSTSTDAVAARSLLAYRAGIRVLVPSVVDVVAAIVLKLVPHRLTLPLVGLLARPRHGKAPPN